MRCVQESAEGRDDPVTHNLKGDVDRGQQIGRGRGCRYQEEEARDPGKVRRGDDGIVGSTNFSCARRNQGPRIARRVKLLGSTLNEDEKSDYLRQTDGI